MKNKNLYYILGGVLVIGVVALVAMQLRGSSSLQGNLGVMSPRSTVGTTKPKTLTPNPVATDSSPKVVANSDLLPPTVNITTAGGKVVTGAQLEVTALVKDDLALDKMELYVDGVKVNTTTANSVKEFTYKYAVNLSPIADGVHKLQVKAYDKVGHITESHITFGVSNNQKQNQISPVILDVTSPTKGQKIKVADNKLDFSVSLKTQGLDTVKYSVDGTLVKAVTSSPDFSWVSPVFAWGQHDGVWSWHIYPKAFAYAISGLTADPSEHPTPLECFPYADVTSCAHTIKIEGLSKGKVMVTKEIDIEVWGSLWLNNQAAISSVYIDVKSVK